MKPFALITVSLLFLFSCSKENKDPLTKEAQQKWVLVKIISTFSVDPSVTTGSDMPWQEYYIFNADNTFLKSHIQDGQLKEASGTYTINNEKKWH
jgi:hypothetical protein